MFIRHAGFDLDDPVHAFAFHGMGSGWRSHILRTLHHVLTQLP
jgi:hypothetical protein